MSLFAELKRRNVFRVALLYIIAGWLVLQVADVLFEQLGIPGWAFRFVFALLLICFPLVVVFSWVFEITPEGIKREQDIAEQESITAHTGRKISRATTVLLVLTILVVVADRLIPETTSEPAPQIAEPPTALIAEPEVPVFADETKSIVDDKSIAVLPFINMSGDEENEYFSDGLSEELLNSLVAIKDLKVTGRTSSFAFKGTNEDLRNIGEKLNVAHLLEGSVRKANNRVRITAQLIKVDDGYHLWSKTFDRELDDIFAIQEEIAQQVTTALSVVILGTIDAAKGISGTRDTNAWDAYLRGSYIFRQNLDDGVALQRGVEEMQKAIAIDPGFVKAHVGLFLLLWRQTINGYIPFDEGIAAAKEIVDTVYALAPGDGGVLQIKSRYHVMVFEWDEADITAKKALEVAPGDIDTLNQVGNMAYFKADHEAAITSAEKAVSLDPLSIIAFQYLAFAYSSAGQCDGVARVTRRAFAIEPGHSRTHYWLGKCLLVTDNAAEAALAAFEKETLQWQRLTGVALANIALGNESAADAAMDELMAVSGETSSYQFAMINAYRGNTEKAFEWLQRAYEIRDPGISHIGVDPFLDSLRDDDRFKAIKKKVGF